MKTIFCLALLLAISTVASFSQGTDNTPMPDSLKFGPTIKRSGVSILVFTLGKENWGPGLRCRAADKLGDLGDKKATDVLIAALSDKDESLRIASAEALGKIGDQKAIIWLVETLDDKSSGACKAASEALVKFGPAALPALMAKFKNKNENYNPSIGIILLRIGNPAMDPLAACLNDPDRAICLRAAELLGKLNYSPSTDQARVTYFSITMNWDELVKVGKPAIPTLLGFLGDSNEKTRSSAKAALNRLNYNPVTETDQLIYFTATQNWEGLVKIGKPAIGSLTGFLCHSEVAVRASAANALRKLNYVPSSENEKLLYYPLIRNVEALIKLGTPAVPALISLLGDSDKTVRTTAVTALGKMGDQRAIEPLVGLLKDKEAIVKETASGALLKFGSAAVPSLIACVGSETGPARQSAIAVLTRIGKPVMGPLVAVLNNENPQVRNAAAEVLKKLNYQPTNVNDKLLYDLATKNWDGLAAVGKPAVEPLLVILNGTDRSSRRMAAEALGKLKDTAYIAPLVNLLADRNATVRTAAGNALCGLGSASIPLLLDCLQGKSEEMRQSAISVLGRLGKPATESLVAQLEDADLGTRKSAAEAMEKMKYVPVTERSRIIYYSTLKNWTGLVSVGQPAVPTLAGFLSDPDPNTSQSAGDALEKLNYKPSGEQERLLFYTVMRKWEGLFNLGQPAVETLIVFLKEKEESARAKAAETLGRIGDTRALMPLVPLLRDADLTVRQSALNALDKLGYAPDGVEETITYLIAKNDRPAVVKLGKPAVEELLKLLNSSNSGNWKEVVAALGEIGDERAAAPLVARLSDNNYYQNEEYVTALTKIGKPAVPHLIAAIPKNSSALESIILTLQQIGDTSAIPSLVNLMPDWDHNREIGEALESFKWTPVNEKEKVYFWITRKDSKNLLRNWEFTKQMLMSDVTSKNSRLVENAVNSFISLGNVTVLPELTNILQSAGDAEMAVTYLNCGNKRLSDAARQWASDHGYTVVSSGGGGSASWGNW
jgi:HEAT repeat protein